MRRTSTYRPHILEGGDSQIGDPIDQYSTDRGTYLLTQEEVSQLFRVTVRTVQRWTRLDLIPSVKIGGVTRYDIDEVRRSLGNGVQGILTGLEIVR
jgi:hypothetical protein